MDAKAQRILNIYETGVSETELTETLKTKINASTGGSLGSIKPTDAAPTPARNGNYTFSIGGNKPAWLTAEAGVTTVKAGDGVAVVYTAPSSYTYTHVDMSSAFLLKTNQTLTSVEQSAVQKNIGIREKIINKIAFIGADSQIGIQNGDLFWDAINSKIVKYGFGDYISYDENTVFTYENTSGIILLKFPSPGELGDPIIINNNNIKKVSVFKTAEPIVATEPHRFGDYCYSSSFNRVYLRTEQFWDWSTTAVPNLTLVDISGTLYQKSTNGSEQVLSKIPYVNYSYPILWCKDNVLRDKFLNAITDIKYYGFPELDEIWINRLYNLSGLFKVELAYTQKNDIDASWYGLTVDLQTTEIDFVTDKITTLTLNSTSGGFVQSHVKAIISINFSKVNPSLLYTDINYNKSVMRFCNSNSGGTFPLNVDLLLPANYPVIVNKDMRICMESACVQADVIDKMLNRGFSVQTSLGGCSEIIETKFTTAGTTVFKAYLLESGVRKKVEFMNIKSIDSSVGSGVTKKIVVCGDSKTDKTTKLEHLLSLFESDVMDITLLGTQETGTFPNEGYSGRNVIDLTTSATLNGIVNPFYNAEKVGTYKFDITTFISAVGAVPDIVFIDHGANQGFVVWANVKAAYDAIIANIANYNTANSTSIAVVISIQESGSLLPNIAQAGGLTTGKYSLMKHGRNMLNEYDNREAELIFICPQHLYVDCENDFPYALVPAFNNIGVLVKKTTDSVHPGAQSFSTYNVATTYNKGGQVTNSGEYFVAVKNGVVGITPSDDKINWAKVVDGIGAGYKNIAEIYFNVIKYIQSLS